MQLSHRHHYVPQFLLRNFADEDELLYLYDKSTGRINKRQLVPKAVFFEPDRNTIVVDGQPTDHLEKLYADWDDEAALDLQQVLAASQATPEQVVRIAALASMLKWRVPGHDAAFNTLKEQLTMADLRAEIRPVDPTTSVNQAALNQLLASPLLQESKRVLLPLLPLFQEGKLADIQANWFIHQHSTDSFPSLVGDCPVLERPHSAYDQLEDFIFPLSSSATFIYKRQSSRRVSSPLFPIQKDLATLHYADRYVACKSRVHLENILKFYAELERSNQVEKLTKFLFDFID